MPAEKDKQILNDTRKSKDLISLSVCVDIASRSSMI